MIETNIFEQLLPRVPVFESLGEAMSKFLLGLDITNLQALNVSGGVKDVASVI